MRRITAGLEIFLLLLLVTFTGFAGRTEAQQDNRFTPRPDGVPDEYIVVLHDGAVHRDRDAPGVGSSVSDLASRLAGQHKAKVLATYEHALNGFAVRLPAAAAKALSQDPRVRFVEQNAVFPLQNVTMDCRFGAAAPVHSPGPLSSGSPQDIICADPDPNAAGCVDNWGLDRIDQRAVSPQTPRDGQYSFSTDASAVHAYLFDTGLNADHSEFAGRVDTGFDAINSGNTADCTIHGHGTHVAGILGGMRYGVAKGVRFHPVKVASCGSGVNLNALLKGIDWVVANHPPGQPAVANLSANGAIMHGSRAAAAALTALIQDGIVFVESAGNQNADAEAFSLVGPEFPSEVIIAGGMDERDARWTRVDSDPDDLFYCGPAGCTANPCTGDCASNFGPAIDVWAPAAHIISTSRYAVDGIQDGICSLSGTSMAAPHVTGVAALLLARFPNASPSAIEKAILRNASLGELDSSSIGAGSPNRLLYSIFPGTGAPVAGNDRFRIEPDAPFTILFSTLLAGDFDYDNSPLQVISTVNPINGGTLQKITGGVRYIPAPGFHGRDFFNYTISDGSLTDTGTVELVVRAAPVAGDDFFTLQQTPQNSILRFSNFELLDNDSDPDGAGVTPLGFTSQPSHGTILEVSQGNFEYTPSAGFVGTDSFRYKVRDDDYLEDEATVFVTVQGANGLPVANPDSATTNAGVAVLINVTANDTDPELGALTVASVTQPAHGTAAVSGAGGVLYTPAAGYRGSDSFTYIVRDPQGGQATGTVSVTIVNRPPTANPDTAATNEDTPVTINVTANDTDPDGDSRTVAEILTPPAHGTATIAGAGSITYSPAANYSGSDSFVYRIRDGFGGLSSASVTVTITEVNDNPVATPDAATTNEDTAVTVNVIANDTDVDDTSLQLAAALTTLPAHGTATIVSATQISYTPSPNYFGTDSLVYRVRDNRGGRADATLTITVVNVNDIPVANADSITTNEDTAVSINVTANDTDADGNALVVAAILTAPAHGTATIASASNVLYTPAPNFNGTDSFRYRIRDGNGGLESALVTVTVTAVNDQPVANADTAITNKNTAVTINVTANDTDVDGDPLTLLSIVTAPLHGTVTILNASSLRYTPATNYLGTDTFTYQIGDGNGRRSNGTVTVTVR